MVVAVVRLTLRIPENQSLKEKRRVLKQLIERTRNRFGISIAETAHMDQHQSAEIGMACVGNDRRVVNSVLDKAAAYIESLQTALITGHELEIVNL